MVTFILITWLGTCTLLFANFGLQLIAPKPVHEYRNEIFAIYCMMLFIAIVAAGFSYLSNVTALLINSIILTIPWLVLIGGSIKILDAKSVSNVFSISSGEQVGTVHGGFNIVLLGNYEVRISAHSKADTVMHTGEIVDNERPTDPVSTSVPTVEARYKYGCSLGLAVGEQYVKRFQEFDNGPDAAIDQAYSYIDTVFIEVTQEFTPLEILTMGKSQLFAKDFLSIHHSYMVQINNPMRLRNINIKDTGLPKEVTDKLMSQYLQSLDEDRKDEVARRFKKRADELKIDITTKTGIEILKFLAGELPTTKTITELKLDVTDPAAELLLDVLGKFLESRK